MAIELSPEHYQLIKDCAECGDFTQWNEFVERADEIIRLREGDFSGWDLAGASFYTPKGEYMDLHSANFEGAKIEGVSFNRAKLFRANFKGAQIKTSSFSEAELYEACFSDAELVLTDLNLADLQCANFANAGVYGANLYEANFVRADLRGGRFQGSLMPIGRRSTLCGADFRDAQFDHKTYFEDYEVSIRTDFRTVSFEAANFSQGLRQALRYCNRRHNWNDWYRNNNFLLGAMTKLFWSLSDYGFSPARVLSSFSISVFMFALIYFAFPQLVDGIDRHDLMASIYFSVVTMTTLGFGDMHAQDNWIAQLMVMTQVLLGYVLLGSLITVLSDLFFSDGPSQRVVPHGKRPRSFVARVTDYNAE